MLSYMNFKKIDKSGFPLKTIEHIQTTMMMMMTIATTSNKSSLH